MRQPCAKSKAVEGQYGFGVVAKSKDYSIYSHVLRVVIGALLKGSESRVPLFRPQGGHREDQ